MRYKALVTQKLESLNNSLNALNSVVRQNQSREQIDHWFAVLKEKIEEVQTLINTESDQLYN